MKKRLLCLLLSVVLLAFPLTGCGGEGVEIPTPTPTETGGEVEARQLVLPVYRGDSLHPALGDNKTNAALAPLLYEGLFALDEDFTPRMVLCRSYVCSADGLEWRFTLRDNVSWSDGTPLLAEDVAAALNTARGTDSRYAKRLRSVTGVTAEGESTVAVTLSGPNGSLPALLDIPLAKDESDRPAGTGPYSLADGDSGMVLTLRRDWWQRGEQTLGMTSIALMDISSTDDLLYAFDTREIDLVITDFTGGEALGFSSDYAVWEYDTTNLIYLGFRCHEGSPCTDPALRGAISSAIDRQTLADGVFAHHAKAAVLPVSPASPLYDDGLGTAEGDSGAALLALEGRTELKLTLLVCNENPFKLTAAHTIAERLGQYGLVVTVASLPFGEYLTALQQGRYDLYLGEVAMTADFDPTALVGTGGSLNYGGYTDPTTDSLLTALRGGDEVQRPAAAGELYRDLLAKTPIAPLCFKTGSVLTQWGRMNGLAPTAANPFYGMTNWTFS